MRFPYLSMASLGRLVICVSFLAEIPSPTHGHVARLEAAVALALLATVFLSLAGDLLGWRSSIKFSHHLPKFDAIALASLEFLSLATALHPFLPSLQFAVVLCDLRVNDLKPRRISSYGQIAAALVVPIIAILLFDGQLNGGRVVHLIALLTLTALTILVLGWMSPSRISPSFVVDGSASNYEALAGAADYALKQIGSRDAKLIWLDPDTQSWEIRECGVDVHQPGISIGLAALGELRNLPLMIFDLTRDIFLVFAEDGQSVNAARNVPNPALWKQMEMTRGVCLPIGEPDDPTILVLNSRKRSHWMDLVAARRISREVTRGLKEHRAAMETKEAAMLRLRNAIAMDLHDSVAQSLAGARLMLNATISSIQDVKLKHDLKSIRKSLDDESGNVRNLIGQLKDTSDHGAAHDLIEKLEVLVALARSRWNLDVQLKNSQFQMLVPDWLSLEIQQLVREAISNSVRHGSADQVSVSCNRKRDGIWISISDNGTGFDAKMQTPRSITERVADLKGEALFYSQAGSTQVAIRLPSIEI